MKSQEIKIDTTAIPDYVRDSLAEATLQLIRGILRQPGGREMMDEKIAAMRQAAAEK